MVLSEGYNLYFGSPERVLGWFADTLGYPYDYARDGAVSDWLMDLVSVGFQKPESFRDRRVPRMQCSYLAPNTMSRRQPQFASGAKHSLGPSTVCKLAPNAVACWAGSDLFNSRPASPAGMQPTAHARLRPLPGTISITYARGPCQELASRVQGLSFDEHVGGAQDCVPNKQGPFSRSWLNPADSGPGV